MSWRTLPIADVVQADGSVEKLDGGPGYVVVRCPFDDGTNDHALHICNPCGDLPAHAYCLSASCKDVVPDEFLILLGLNVRFH